MEVCFSSLSSYHFVKRIGTHALCVNVVPSSARLPGEAAERPHAAVPGRAGLEE